MPSKSIADIIAKALSDAEFRKRLIQQPDKALAGYGLTVQEMALIVSGLAKDQAAGPAPELDERVSKARLPLGFLGDFARQYSGADDPPDSRFADQARALRIAAGGRSASPSEAPAPLSAEDAARLAKTDDIAHGRPAEAGQAEVGHGGEARNSGAGSAAVTSNMEPEEDSLPTVDGLP